MTRTQKHSEDKAKDKEQDKDHKKDVSLYSFARIHLSVHCH